MSRQSANTPTPIPAQNAAAKADPLRSVTFSSGRPRTSAVICVQTREREPPSVTRARSGR